MMGKQDFEERGRDEGAMSMRGEGESVAVSAGRAAIGDGSADVFSNIKFPPHRYIQQHAAITHTVFRCQYREITEQKSSRKPK